MMMMVMVMVMVEVVFTIETQKSQSVGLLTFDREACAGSCTDARHITTAFADERDTVTLIAVRCLG